VIAFLARIKGRILFPLLMINNFIYSKLGGEDSEEEKKVRV
jgi:hypothetical protein